MSNIKWHGKLVEKKIITFSDKKLQKAALMVERTAKKIAPVLTGTLKRSIISNWSGSKRARSVSWPAVEKKVLGRTYKSEAGRTTIRRLPEGTAIVGTNVEYAPFVEKDNSFLQRALEMESNNIAALFKGD